MIGKTSPPLAVVCWLVVAVALVLNCGAQAQPTPSQSGLKANVLRLASGDDLALAKALDGALDDVTRAVTACTEQGKSLEACQCARIDVVQKLGTVFTSTLRERPSWAGQDVILYWEQDGRSINLAPGGIRRALALVLDRCGKG